MKDLYILSPNDRFNYGDLIFPHILYHYFQDIVDNFFFCSTCQSDLSSLGSFPTHNHRTLYTPNPKHHNYLIVGGGDTLCAEWNTVLSFVDNNINFLSILDHKFKTNWFTNIYRHIKYQAQTTYPYTIGKNELKGFCKIFYNSVGGSALEDNFLYHVKDLKVSNILNTVDYISLRDKQTSELLNSLHIKNVIVPDSAILMSSVFSEEDLLSHIQDTTLKLKNKRYIFFQTNLTYLDTDRYANIIDEIISTENILFCLCPIGTALGHSDNIALKKIHNKIKKKKSTILISYQPNIYDIMWLIKHSILYVGTSLHGTITALSFNTPFIAHGPKKLKNYISTWIESENAFIDEKKELKNAIQSQIQSPTIYNSEHQKKMVLYSLECMKAMIYQEK